MVMIMMIVVVVMMILRICPFEFSISNNYCSHEDKGLIILQLIHSPLRSMLPRSEFGHDLAASKILAAAFKEFSFR